jgi:uncharacterized protein (TIGR02466 family)
MSIPKLIDVNPFEPIIIKAHYDGFDWSKLESICKKLIKDSNITTDMENEHGMSSVTNKIQPHTIKEFTDFYKWLQPIASYIVTKEWDFFYKDVSILNSWVNVHYTGGITREHHHASTPIVAATYLNMPENGGFIEYKDPSEHFKGFFDRNESDELAPWKQVNVVSGDVLLFPGWVRHRTQANENLCESRWVLTTNIITSISK